MLDKEEDVLVKDVEVVEKVEEEKSDVISEYFEKEITESELKNTAKVFGQSDVELSKEFREFKAKKVFSKLDYAIVDNKKSYENLLKDLAEARKYGFNSVTVFPSMIGTAKSTLKSTSTSVRALISFPHGEDIGKVKIYSAKRAFNLGADSLAVTLSVSAIKNGGFGKAVKEIKKIVKIAGSRKVSAIVDGKSLSPVELEKICSLLAKECKVFSIIPTVYGDDVINLQTVRDTFRAVEGKCYIEAGGNCSLAEEAISALDAGAYGITSIDSVNIALNLTSLVV